MSELVNNIDMINEIKNVLLNARKNVAQQVNPELLNTYWNIGKIIIENEQKNNLRDEYGKQTLKELSKILTNEFGRGFMFVGTQQRVTLNDTHYYVDMVFYNKILRA